MPELAGWLLSQRTCDALQPSIVAHRTLVRLTIARGLLNLCMCVCARARATHSEIVYMFQRDKNTGPREQEQRVNIRNVRLQWPWT